MRDGAEPASDKDGEAALLLAIDFARLRQQAQVVHHDQTAGVSRASREGHFEFAPEILDIIVAEQELSHGIGVGADIKDFVVADAGQGASGDIAHGIAAGFLGGDADGCQAPHQVRSVVDVHVMQLDILPRGDMQDAIGVFVRQLGQDLELIRRETAIGDLDALHARRVPERVGTLDQIARGITQLARLDAVVALAIVIALPVSALAQALLGEDFFVQLALLAQFNLRFVGVESDYPSAPESDRPGSLSSWS